MTTPPTIEDNIRALEAKLALALLPYEQMYYEAKLEILKGGRANAPQPKGRAEG